MQVVILAAGLGNRLGDLTENHPKALVRVAGRELILYVKDFLDHPQISECIIVTGYLAPMLERFLTIHWPEAGFVHNPHFAKGSIHSIETALTLIKDDFLIMNVDHIYPRRLLPLILKTRDRITAVCDFDRTLTDDDMKVKLNSNRTLAKIHKQLAEFDCGYIGMTFVPKLAFKNYRSAAHAVRTEDGETEAVEKVLARLASENNDIHMCDATGFGWLEIDTPEDLARAEGTLATKQGFLL